MKNKLCIIIPYFGKFPDTIDAFFQSCQFNPDFDWLIFTDCNYNNIPKNVKFIYTTLNELKELIEKKLDISVALNTPYKVCDYRPAFGIIFEDYIKDYDFWGYGDIDLIYGDLSQFINDDLCDSYDKIYPCGHLSFIRNRKEINEIFKKELKGTHSYKDVFTDDKSFIFDEYQGLNEKLSHSGYKIYSKFDFVDIDLAYNRLRRVNRRTINLVFPNYPFKKNLPKNHKLQLFHWTNGKAFSSYKTFGDIKNTELVYIHYRKKLHLIDTCPQNDKYFITNNGIFTTTEKVTVESIKKHNSYPGILTELFEYLRFFKTSMIYLFGKNKTLRNFIRKIKGKGSI